jgi:hypothetical protein
MNLSDKLGGFESVSLTKSPLDPGAYILVCEKEPTDEWDEKGDKEYLQMEYKVVEGPEQQTPDTEFGTNPVGRTMKERLYLTPDSQWKLKSLLVAMGKLDRNDKTSDMARGNFGTDSFIGGTFNAEVVHNMKDGKTYANLKYVY